MNYIKILKIAVGAALSIILAESLGLGYSASAGVITLLSIQDTKKETIRVMARRLFSFGLALIFAAGSFALLGYTAPAVGVFLLFFSAVCIRFHMQEGISVNTVLMTHFLAERSMSLENIGNEMGLLLIGCGIGVLLNLYIPGKKKQIKMKQRRIEACMKEILDMMAHRLSGSGYEDGLAQSMAKLEEELRLGEQSAYEEMENKLLTETRYYIRYMNMRKMQSLVLGKIAGNIGHLTGSGAAGEWGIGGEQGIAWKPGIAGERGIAVWPQAGQIAELMRQISSSFHEYNNAVELLGELEMLKLSMREQPLPGDRREFENRAVLFQILLELEQLLVLKKEFVLELTGDEIGKFWKEECGAEAD